MKKIKSIKQLKAEQRRLQQQQKEAEDKIRLKWHELKELLHPGTITKDTLSSILESKPAANGKGETILKSTLAYGISLFAKKMTGKAFSAVDKIFTHKSK